MLSVHLENGQVTVRRRPTPRRRKGYALIRLLSAGICNTDLELRRGYYGFRGTPGHEFVGEVTEADEKKLLNRRVVGEINLGCGECEWCLRGLGRHCPRRKVLGIVRHPGVFSEFFTLPERNLHVLPASLATEDAVFTEPLAAACEILEQVKLPPGAEAAVLGDGKLGLLAAQVLSIAGARVVLFGCHPRKLRIAARTGIATRRVPGRKPPCCFDLVVEATGSSEGLAQAISMARPRGIVVMKSTIHGAVTIDTAPAVVNEVALLGSRCGRFEPALKLLRAGKVSVREMISARYKLAEAPQAFEHAARKGTLKVLLEA